MNSLLSSERKLVAEYIRQPSEIRAEILAAAIADPKASGPLIAAYRQAESTT